MWLRCIKMTHRRTEVLSIISVEFLSFTGQSWIKNQFITTPARRHILRYLRTVLLNECIWRDAQNNMKTMNTEGLTQKLWFLPLSFCWSFFSTLSYMIRSHCTMLVNVFLWNLKQTRCFDTHPDCVVKEAAGPVSQEENQHHCCTTGGWNLWPHPHCHQIRPSVNIKGPTVGFHFITGFHSFIHSFI